MFVEHYRPSSGDKCMVSENDLWKQSVLHVSHFPKFSEGSVQIKMP